MKTLLTAALVGIAVLGVGGRLAAADRDTGRDADRAHILVRLPEDAKLTINGAATKATSGTRYFVTPPLKGGKEFHYDLKAEYVRDGKTITVKKTIAVRPGRDTVVSLDPSGSTSAFGNAGAARPATVGTTTTGTAGTRSPNVAPSKEQSSVPEGIAGPKGSESGLGQLSN